ncbi:MAG: hypothetical protein FWE48_07580, partial [Coriobacteriia bacterium]|nr:hypothetical protein [Coriobacteriia bacterium]
EDYRQQLLDLLAVCRADETSDRPRDSFDGMCGTEHFNIIESCALQTFEVCSQIQARDLPDYAELQGEQLKQALRKERVAAVKRRVNFFAA